MKLFVVYQPTVSASTSPYRVRGDQGAEPDWANAFLDGQRLRQLSLRSLRIYAYDLLNFARWFAPQHRPLAEITESTLVDYVRHQLEQNPKPSPQTVNHRLGTVQLLPLSHRTGNSRRHSAFPAPLHPTLSARLRPAPDRRRPGNSPQTRAPCHRAALESSTYRDLALIGLMLLVGLRSCEVLAVELEDVQLADGQMRLHGKGNKQRLVPLHPDILDVLGHYLRLERPLTNAPALFVSLKGRQRGRPLTAAGLRSLFRHHRLCSLIRQANPHRLRHTFGADMVRAGMSLPALQRLMPHSQIATTMLYVQIAPQDVWREYARAIEKRKKLGTEHLS